MLLQHKNHKNKLHPLIYIGLGLFVLYVANDAMEHYNKHETRAAIIEFYIDGAIDLMQDQELRFTKSE